MRDSGLDISYALRADAIATKRQSFVNASSNGFTVGTYEELIPSADMVPFYWCYSGVRVPLLWC
jgi:ketol-acid reductoisomerase